MNECESGGNGVCTDLHFLNVLFCLTKKEPKKSRLYENPAILLETCGGAKKNSPRLRRTQTLFCVIRLRFRKIGIFIMPFTKEAS
jgi:hypothetical protein